MSLPGSYLDGRSPVPRPVMLERDHHQLVFTDGVKTHRYPAGQVDFETGLPGLPDKLRLPDGGVIEVAQQHRCRHMAGGPPPWERLLAWLHGGWTILVVLLIATVAAVWFAYRDGLPWLAAKVVRQTPVAMEKQMAEQTMALLNKTVNLRPSGLSDARQRQLQGLLDQVKPANSPYHYELTLVDSADIGPNAFALPGGHVLMTDQLVRAAKSDNEIMAVLAHEAGHVENRHGLRSVVQYGGVSLAITLLTGDSTSMLALAPALLADMKYSRDFEREADHFAFTQLEARHVSPCVLGQFLQRMSGRDDGSANLLASHPSTEERSHPNGAQCPAGG